MNRVAWISSIPPSVGRTGLDTWWMFHRILPQRAACMVQDYRRFSRAGFLGRIHDQRFRGFLVSHSRTCSPSRFSISDRRCVLMNSFESPLSGGEKRGLITSPRNPRYKLARKLLETGKRKRINEDKIVIEGHRLVISALEAGVNVHTLFVCDEALNAESGQALKDAMKKYVKHPEVRIQKLSYELIQDISDTVTPQGVVCMANQPRFPEIEAALFPTTDEKSDGSMADGESSFSPKQVLILDQIRDPGNLGTLLRSAIACGIDLVLCTKGTVDPWSLKALRSGMGAQFHGLPVIELEDTEPQLAHVLAKYDLPLYIAESAGSLTYSDVDWTQRSAIVVGNEAHGPSKEVLKLQSKLITIPMVENKMESLNAAIAGSIIMFEGYRQRLIAGKANNVVGSATISKQQ